MNLMSVSHTEEKKRIKEKKKGKIVYESNIQRVKSVKLNRIQKQKDNLIGEIG